MSECAGMAFGQKGRGIRAKVSALDRRQSAECRAPTQSGTY